MVNVGSLPSKHSNKEKKETLSHMSTRLTWHAYSRSHTGMRSPTPASTGLTPNGEAVICPNSSDPNPDPVSFTQEKTQAFATTWTRCHQLGSRILYVERWRSFRKVNTWSTFIEGIHCNSLEHCTRVITFEIAIHYLVVTDSYQFLYWQVFPAITQQSHWKVQSKCLCSR